MTDFTMKTDADGVATITWDVNLEAINFLKPGMMLKVQEDHPDGKAASPNKS